MSKLYLTPNKVKDCICHVKGISLDKYGHRLVIRSTVIRTFWFSVECSALSDLF